MSEVKLDSLLPAEVAAKAEDVGVRKGNLDLVSMFMLALLAGAFIGLGALGFTTVVTSPGVALPWGVARLLGGLVFCLGLILVVVGGAELFTGNNLLVMATASGKLSASKLARNWIVVYLGNFVGSILTAYLVYLSAQWLLADGQVGLKAVAIAEAKCQLPWSAAFYRGIYCNALVCLAVWLTMSCRTTGDKILAIIWPITAFVMAGFEHCVANMYFVPLGLFIRGGAPAEFWAAVSADPAGYPALSWGNFLFGNLVPVTLGNIVGGALFVGGVYWVIYLRRRSES